VRHPSGFEGCALVDRQTRGQYRSRSGSPTAAGVAADGVRVANGCGSRLVLATYPSATADAADIIRARGTVGQRQELSEREHNTRMLRARRPVGVTLLALFFVFGMLMASLSVFMLLFPAVSWTHYGD
jgi:hypothetical protein